jgi:hypothetical protein
VIAGRASAIARKLVGRLRALPAIAVPLAAGFLLTACSDEKDNASDQPSPNPLFYEIARADGSVEGWLLGTIHALPDDTRWRTPEIDAAIAKADALVVEVANLDDEAATGRAFADLASTEGLPPLAQRVAPDLRDDLSAMIERARIDPDRFRSTETWAAALMLAQLDVTGDPANGVDRAVIDDFEGRPVSELEGASAQLAIFDALAEEDQRALLTEVVIGNGELREDPDRLLSTWLAGEEAALEEAARTGMMADPDLREALLVRRNRAWLAAILAELEDEPRPLVAVGAAHLVGTEGLAALIEDEGFTVRRLP